MHDCDLCGQVCDCDMEDMFQSQPDDCTHVCDEDEDYDDEDDYEDDERENRYLSVY